MSDIDKDEFASLLPTSTRTMPPAIEEDTGSECAPLDVASRLSTHSSCSVVSSLSNLPFYKPTRVSTASRRLQAGTDDDPLSGRIPPTKPKTILGSSRSSRVPQPPPSTKGSVKCPGQLESVRPHTARLPPALAEKLQHPSLIGPNSADHALTSRRPRVADNGDKNKPQVSATAKALNATMKKLLGANEKAETKAAELKETERLLELEVAATATRKAEEERNNGAKNSVAGGGSSMATRRAKRLQQMGFSETTAESNGDNNKENTQSLPVSVLMKTCDGARVLGSKQQRVPRKPGLSQPATGRHPPEQQEHQGGDRLSSSTRSNANNINHDSSCDRSFRSDSSTSPGGAGGKFSSSKRRRRRRGSVGQSYLFNTDFGKNAIEMRKSIHQKINIMREDEDERQAFNNKVVRHLRDGERLLKEKVKNRKPIKLANPNDALQAAKTRRVALLEQEVMREHAVFCPTSSPRAPVSTKDATETDSLAHRRWLVLIHSSMATTILLQAVLQQRLQFNSRIAANNHRITLAEVLRQEYDKFEGKVRAVAILDKYAMRMSVAMRIHKKQRCTAMIRQFLKMKYYVAEMRKSVKTFRSGVVTLQRRLRGYYYGPRAARVNDWSVRWDALVAVQEEEEAFYAIPVGGGGGGGGATFSLSMTMQSRGTNSGKAGATGASGGGTHSLISPQLKHEALAKLHCKLAHQFIAKFREYKVTLHSHVYNLRTALKMNAGKQQQQLPRRVSTTRRPSHFSNDNETMSQWGGGSASHFEAGHNEHQKPDSDEQTTTTTNSSFTNTSVAADGGAAVGNDSFLSGLAGGDMMMMGKGGAGALRKQSVMSAVSSTTVSPQLQSNQQQAVPFGTALRQRTGSLLNPPTPASTTSAAGGGGGGFSRGVHSQPHHHRSSSVTTTALLISQGLTLIPQAPSFPEVTDAMLLELLEETKKIAHERDMAIPQLSESYEAASRRASHADNSSSKGGDSGDTTTKKNAVDLPPNENATIGDQQTQHGGDGTCQKEGEVAETCTNSKPSAEGRGSAAQADTEPCPSTSAPVTVTWQPVVATANGTTTTSSPAPTVSPRSLSSSVNNKSIHSTSSSKHQNKGHTTKKSISRRKVSDQPPSHHSASNSSSAILMTTSTRNDAPGVCSSSASSKMVVVDKDDDIAAAPAQPSWAQ